MVMYLKENMLTCNVTDYVIPVRCRAVGNLMFWGMQYFDFAQTQIKSNLPKS